MRPNRPLLLIVAATTVVAEQLPETLSFVPTCAHACIRHFLAAYIAAPFSSCQTWAGNTNPEVVAETSAEKIRVQIAWCVLNDCGTAANQDATFQEALKGVCRPVRAASASTNTSAGPTLTPAGEGMAQQDTGGGSSSGLAPGVIAGAVLGAVVFLLLVAAVTFFFIRRRSRLRETQHHTETKQEYVERKDWHSLSGANTTPSPPPDVPQPRPQYEHEPMPMRQSRAFDFAFDVEANAGAQVSPVLPPVEERVRPVSVRPGDTEPWSPVSPVSPVIGTFPFAFPPVREEPKEEIRQQQAEGYGQGVVSLPQLPRHSTLARADSVEWRREVEEAAERAATRVGLKASEPILETTPASETRWTRRVSGGVLGKGRRVSGAGR